MHFLCIVCALKGRVLFHCCSFLLESDSHIAFDSRTVGHTEKESFEELVDQIDRSGALGSLNERGDPLT